MIPQNKFKKNAMRLCSHLQATNIKCGSLIEEYKINLALTFIDNMDPKVLTVKFIETTKDEWDHIVNSDLNYFVEHARELFSFLGEQIVNSMIKIVNSDKLNDDDVNRFWKLSKVMIANSIEYLKTNNIDNYDHVELNKLREQIVDSLK